MRLIYGFYLALGLAVAGFLGWRAVVFFPEAWKEFAHRGEKTFKSVRIDSTVFETETSPATDTTRLAQDPGLVGLITILSEPLGIATRRTSVTSSEAGPLPLYTVDFRMGVPLAERVQILSDSFATHGFRLDESSERPRAKYPWAARVSRHDTTVALLRGRAAAPPGPGTFRMHVGFWSDSLTVAELAALEKLPAGSLVALKPEAFAAPQLSAIARRRRIDLAVALKLETSLYPVSLQEKTRLLLHHDEGSLGRRLLPNDSVEPLAKGVVVLDGDRGARDPVLSGRVASFLRDRSWWLLDASRVSASRLEDAAETERVGILAQPRRTESDPAAAFEAAAKQAESDGESALLVKLDTIAVAKLAAFVPLLVERGVAIVPWPVLHRRPTGD